MALMGWTSHLAINEPLPAFSWPGVIVGADLGVCMPEVRQQPLEGKGSLSRRHKAKQMLALVFGWVPSSLDNARHRALTTRRPRPGWIVTDPKG